MIDDVVVVQSGLPSMMESERDIKPSPINTMNKTVSCFDHGNLLILHKKNNFTKDSNQTSFTKRDSVKEQNDEDDKVSEATVRVD